MERYVSIIEERAEAMKKLTEELYSYSLIANAEEPAELEEICLNRVLEDCIMEYYAAMTEQGITPKIEITERKILRRLHKDHVDRTISNVISNAIKYSLGDFEIRLTDEGEMTFTNAAPDMTALQVERLFDRFFTVETGRNSTGLGLAIARTFVEQMGGSIDASLADGRLTIRMSFPC